MHTHFNQTRWFQVIAVLLGFLLSTAGYTEDLSWEDVDANLKPCEAHTFQELGWIDRSHVFLSQQLCDRAEWLDSYLIEQDEEKKAGKASSYVNVKLKYSGYRLDPHEIKPRINAKIYLPKMKHKLNLFVSSYREDLPTLQQNQTEPNRRIGNNSEVLDGSTEDAGITTALGREKSITDDWSWGTKFGVRFSGFSVIGTAKFDLKWKKFIQPKKHLNFHQQFYYYTDDGLGSKSEFVYERIEAGDTIFTSRTSAQYKLEEKHTGFNWTQQLSVSHFIDNKSSFYHDYFINGNSKPKWQTEVYGASWVYRQSYFRPWFYVNYQPQVTFSRVHDFDFNPGFILVLEAFIGKVH